MALSFFMVINTVFEKINQQKNHKYYYLSPHVYAVGNCSEEIYYGLIKARLLKKKLIILYPFDILFIFRYKLTNSYLFSLESDYIYRPSMLILFFTRLLMTIIYGSLRMFSLFARKVFNAKIADLYQFPSIGRDDLFVIDECVKSNFDFDLVAQFNWKDKFRYNFNFIIGGRSGESIDLYISSIGIPNNARFVCIHVREGGFRDDIGRKDYRNSDINNYILAMKEITSRGIWVVRMGDSTMKPLPKMKNVIDYPFSKFKSDFMDLYLIKHCYFFIACQSGIFDTAKLFNKPVLIINAYNWTFGGPFHRRDRGIIKHIYSVKEKHYLSTKELFSSRWEVQNLYGSVNDYIFIENSKEEILDAVVEYLTCLDGGLFIASDLQIKAQNYTKQQARTIFSNNRLAPYGVLNDHEEVITRYRIASQVVGVEGALCNSYLDKNWDNNILNEVHSHH
jgi:putative glycosyltransferase (TIGR04372 family)